MFAQTDGLMTDRWARNMRTKVIREQVTQKIKILIFGKKEKMIIFFKGTATTTGRVLMLWPTRLSSIMSKSPRTQTVYIVNSRLKDEGLQVTF